MSATFDIPMDLGTLRNISRNGKLTGNVVAPLSALSQRVKGYCKKHYRNMYANDFSVLNPTIWANEAILQLQPNMVLGSLVNRDFDTKVAKFGDIVNALVPGTFQMTRKGSLCDNIIIQDASASAVQAQLNQWPQVSFDICDGEENRSALDLIETLLVPAVIAMAQGIDRILSAQVMQFISQAGGHLGGLTSSTVKQYILETREQMNRQNVPLAGRAMILTPNSETEALMLDTIVTAQNTGDGGTALAQAILGQKYGFQFVMAQDQPEVLAGQTSVSTTTTANANPSATTVALTSVTGFAAGQWIVMAGDDKPNQILSIASLVVTLRYPLTRTVASGAVVTTVSPGAVNQSGGYYGTTLTPRVMGYAKAINVDGLVNSPPQVGQIVTFGVDPTIYTIIGISITSLSAGQFAITLDTPLVNAIADNATVNLGPSGKFNFALLPNAFTLINRPLPAPRAATGLSIRTVSDTVNKISLRVTIGYDIYKQAHVVTLDTLIGVGVLSKQLGAVMLG